MNHRNAWVAVPFAIIGAAAIFSCLEAIVKQRAEEQPHGRFTSRAILHRAMAMQALSLLPASAAPSAHKQKFYTTRGKLRQLWDVDCSDGNGRSVGYVQWDADSGDLCILSRSVSRCLYSTPELTQSQAISRAWLLLRQPGIGIPPEQWRLSGTPRRTDSSWKVSMKSHCKRACIVIDKHTGQVIFTFLTPGS